MTTPVIPPISRHVWTDDDGTGLVGTIINNARLQDIYNDIDALMAVVAPLIGAGVAMPGSRNNHTQNNATNPTTQMDLAADMVAFWNPALGLVSAVKAFTGLAVTADVTLDNTRVNGRDQSASFPVTSWIHFYWVLDGNQVKCRASLTAPPTGPTLQGTESAWCYATACYLDGSNHLLSIAARGSRIYYNVVQQVFTGALPTVETAVSLAAAIPPNALDVTLLVQVTTASAGQYLAFRTVSGGLAVSLIYGQVASVVAGDVFVFFPNINQNVYYLASASGCTGTGYVSYFTIPNGGL